jgi:hypothetical protein
MNEFTVVCICGSMTLYEQNISAHLPRMKFQYAIDYTMNADCYDLAIKYLEEKEKGI